MRRSFNRLTLFPSTTGTGTASGNGTVFEVGTYNTGVFVLDITVGSGTDPTLDVFVQSYDCLGTHWYDIGTFATGTGATRERITSSFLSERIRARYAVGGTTATFTFTVAGLVKS